MATSTPKLGLPRPSPSDAVNLANHNDLVDAIDGNAASQAEVEEHIHEDFIHVNYLPENSVTDSMPITDYPKGYTITRLDNHADGGFPYAYGTLETLRVPDVTGNQILRTTTQGAAMFFRATVGGEWQPWFGIRHDVGSGGFQYHTDGEWKTVPLSEKSNTFSKKQTFSDNVEVKGNLVVDGVDLKSSVSNGKNGIATAITDMGQSASGSDTFAQLANKVKDISKDANATAAQVLSGRTYYQGGQKRSGSMANRGSHTDAVSIGKGSNTLYARIPQGAYLTNAGPGYPEIKMTDDDWVESNIKTGVDIFGKTGLFTSDANASASQILSGRTAYVKGSKVSGSMANRSGNVTGQSVSRSGTTVRIRPQRGYYDGGTGNSVQIADADFIASNIRQGKSIFGLSGNLKEGSPFATGTATNINSLTVTGLGFRPQYIVAYLRAANSNAMIVFYSEHGDIRVKSSNYSAVRAYTSQNTNELVKGENSRVTVNSDGFTADVSWLGDYRWFAGRWS